MHLIEKLNKDDLKRRVMQITRRKKMYYYLPDFEKWPAPSSHLKSRTLSSVLKSLNFATNLAGSEYITRVSAEHKETQLYCDRKEIILVLKTDKNSYALCSSFLLLNDEDTKEISSSNTVNKMSLFIRKITRSLQWALKQNHLHRNPIHANKNTDT